MKTMNRKIEEVLDILNRGIAAIEKHNIELERQIEQDRERRYRNILKTIKERP